MLKICLYSGSLLSSFKESYSNADSAQELNDIHTQKNIWEIIIVKNEFEKAKTRIQIVQDKNHKIIDFFLQNLSAKNQVGISNASIVIEKIDSQRRTWTKLSHTSCIWNATIIATQKLPNQSKIFST